ncbi:MAG: triose-phosphate isomerase [Alphaproteobacteria bacterium]|jgi:triosephosphate isomerase (TIM)|nr:triose-phosphate isomerase [Alphaproteobacteria bacterium]MBT5919330.1 triose-phosphate isomerase [Alphaproteobacteria bacterium]
MSASPRSLVAGNWKMNSLRAEASALASAIAAKHSAAGDIACDVLVCPPFHLLTKVAAAIAGSGVQLGAQTCHADVSGAHTGDISAEMIADCGATYVIVGHSERRADHAEDDAAVKTRAEAGHRAGLNAIVCIGETLEERDAGNALKIVESQLAASMPDAATAANTVVAYEPVWAIGTGRTANAEEIKEVHDHIRAILVARFGDDGNGMRILYGGSMKAENADSIMAVENVNGGLIGGAALKAETFWPIVEAALS